MTNPVRSAVIGVGYLGNFHAQKYASLPQSELVAVYDANPEQASKVADSLNTRVATDLNKLLDEVDAVSIVVPTQLHFDIARTCLEAGKHVLLEKPMTTTVDEAKELIDIATRQNALLQIGHLERFNPAILAIENSLTNVQFIESHRVAPFNPRGADVNVILDLMIHDIDIIHDIVKSPATDIKAKGIAVLSSEIDIANARLEFENGCIANVTASRAGLKSERKMRVFKHDAYFNIDFQNRILGIHRKGNGEMFPGVANIDSEQQNFEQGDALLAEIESFLNCIISNNTPKVTGEDGMRALSTAIEISHLLQHTD